MAVADDGSIGDVFLYVGHRAGEATQGVGQEADAQRFAVAADHQIDAFIVPAGKAVVKIYATTHEREELSGVGLDIHFFLRSRLGQADADGLGRRVKDELCRVAHDGVVNQGKVIQGHPHRVDTQGIVGVVTARAAIDVFTNL